MKNSKSNHNSKKLTSIFSHNRKIINKKKKNIVEEEYDDYHIEPNISEETEINANINSNHELYTNVPSYQSKKNRKMEKRNSMAKIHNPASFTRRKSLSSIPKYVPKSPSAPIPKLSVVTLNKQQKDSPSIDNNKIEESDIPNNINNNSTVVNNKVLKPAIKSSHKSIKEKKLNHIPFIPHNIKLTLRDDFIFEYDYEKKIVNIVIIEENTNQSILEFKLNDGAPVSIPKQFINKNVKFSDEVDNKPVDTGDLNKIDEIKVDELKELENLLNDKIE